MGMCVTQFDPKQMERGLICTPGALPTIVAGLARVRKIPYYKGTISTKAKFHITLGHETVMGRVSFFGYHGDSNEVRKTFDFDKEYAYQDELLAPPKKDAAAANQRKAGIQSLW